MAAQNCLEFHCNASNTNYVQVRTNTYIRSLDVRQVRKGFGTGQQIYKIKPSGISRPIHINEKTIDVLHISYDGLINLEV